MYYKAAGAAGPAHGPGPARRVAGERAADVDHAARRCAGTRRSGGGRAPRTRSPGRAGRRRSRGGVFVVGGGGVPRHSGAPRAAGRAQRPDVPDHERRVAVVGEAADRAGSRSRAARSACRPGSTAGRRRREPIVRASTSVATFATWWSPNERSWSTLCCGVFGSGSLGHVPGVAVRLAAVPEHLDQRQEQRALERGSGRTASRTERERVEVDAALEQQAVVHRAHVEHRAVEVGRDRGERAARDAALAVAVVEEPAGVDQRAARRRWNAGLAAKPCRVDQRRARGT